MGQEDVYNLLRKSKKWMNSTEIKEILGGSTIGTILYKLYLHNDIMRREIKLGRHRRYEYKWLR